MIFRELARANCSFTQTTGRRKREVTNLVPMATAFVNNFLGILQIYFTFHLWEDISGHHRIL